MRLFSSLSETVYFAAGKSGGGSRLVAKCNRHAHIAVRTIVPNRRRVGFGRLLDADSPPARLRVFDLDKFGCISGLRFCFRDYVGHTIADAS